MYPYILCIFGFIDGQCVEILLPHQTLAGAQLTYSEILSTPTINIIFSGILNTSTGGFTAA